MLLNSEESDSRGAPEKTEHVGKGGKSYEGKPCARCGGTKRYASSSACIHCAGARCAAWYRANREKVLASSAAWYRANPEKARASSAAWYRANPEKVTAKDAAWRQANREKNAITTSRRQHRRTGVGFPLHGPQPYPADGLCQNPHCRQTSDKRRLCADHDHTLPTNNFRAWLCISCNTALNGNSFERLQWLLDLAKSKRFQHNILCLLNQESA